jgi:hypothetical protein
MDADDNLGGNIIYLNSYTKMKINLLLKRKNNYLFIYFFVK